ncbi:hypothetical protein E4U34_004431 [Claviceps purpurea]|nr:hypothetical protein E4U34_004431 [Claviceps purpurea]
MIQRSPILPLIFTPSLSLLSRPQNADQDRPHCRTAHGERSDCHRHRCISRMQLPQQLLLQKWLELQVSRSFADLGVECEFVGGYLSCIAQ